MWLSSQCQAGQQWRAASLRRSFLALCLLWWERLGAEWEGALPPGSDPVLPSPRFPSHWVSFRQGCYKQLEHNLGMSGSRDGTRRGWSWILLHFIRSDDTCSGGFDQPKSPSLLPVPKNRIVWEQAAPQKEHSFLPVSYRWEIREESDQLRSHKGLLEAVSDCFGSWGVILDSPRTSRSPRNIFSVLDFSAHSGFVKSKKLYGIVWYLFLKFSSKFVSPRIDM